MDVSKIQALLDLIDRVSVPPPGMLDGAIPELNQAIIDRAESDIDVELQVP